MIQLLLLQALLQVFPIVDIATINKGTINTSSFNQKKLLIVNVASASTYTAQLDQLEQLYQQHKDSLMVLAFVSNSFGNEPLDTVALKTLLLNKHISFPVSFPVSVNGGNMHVIYEWLHNDQLNNQYPINITADYQKILLDKNREIVGVFTSAVSPLDNKVQLAIRKNN